MPHRRILILEYSIWSILQQLPVVAAWVELLVAGNGGSCSSHAVVFAFRVLASVPQLVWGLSFYLTFPDYFVQSWHTSYRPMLRVSRLGRKCMQLVGYILSYCGLLCRISNIFVRLYSLVVLVGVGKTLVVLTKNHLLQLLVDYLVLSLYLIH